MKSHEHLSNIIENPSRENVQAARERIDEDIDAARRWMKSVESLRKALREMCPHPSDARVGTMTMGDRGVKCTDCGWAR